MSRCHKTAPSDSSIEIIGPTGSRYFPFLVISRNCTIALPATVSSTEIRSTRRLNRYSTAGILSPETQSLPTKRFSHVTVTGVFFCPQSPTGTSSNHRIICRLKVPIYIHAGIPRHFSHAYQARAPAIPAGHALKAPSRTPRAPPPGRRSGASRRRRPGRFRVLCRPQG